MIDFNDRRRDNFGALFAPPAPYIFDATTYVMPVKLSADELRANAVFGPRVEARQASVPTL